MPADPARTELWPWTLPAQRKRIRMLLSVGFALMLVGVSVMLVGASLSPLYGKSNDPLPSLIVVSAGLGVVVFGAGILALCIGYMWGLVESKANTGSAEPASEVPRQV